MRQKHFRTSAAHRMIDQRIYHGVFAGSPNPYLILTPNLQIVNGNDAFVSVTRVERDYFAGRYMFDAFPDNPADPGNTGVKMLMESFNRALATRTPDTVKFQRYDVRNPNGIWEHRMWDGTSWAVTDEKNAPIAVVLAVREYKTDEVTKLLDEAQVQVEKSKRLVNAGKRLTNEIERLSREVKRGRLGEIETLRKILEEWDVTMH